MRMLILNTSKLLEDFLELNPLPYGGADRAFGPRCAEELVSLAGVQRDLGRTKNRRITSSTNFVMA